MADTSVADTSTPDVAAEAATCATGELKCDSVCVKTQSAHDNCGVCGKVCGAAEACSAGVCTTSCPAGQAVCSGSCVTVATDNKNCGQCGKACGAGEVCSNNACAASCASNLTTCGGDAGAAYCANAQTDNENCGQCGKACGAGESCKAGVCSITCATGQTACAASDAGGSGSAYCATLPTDNRNCGACGTVCSAGQVCSNNVCATSCASSLTTCGADDAGDAGVAYCANTVTDNQNCGTCGKACASGESCTGSTCALTCGAGLDTCGVADSGTAGAAYCANFQTDNTNCGACGRTCGAGLACVLGTCKTTCGAGFDFCAGADAGADSGVGYCANFVTDNANCGVCGRTCGAGEVCSNGTCGTTCASNLTTCDGDAGAKYCANVRTDNTNCGQCGKTCGAGQACVGATCSTTCGTDLTSCTTDAGAGFCANLKTDPSNCNTCGFACGAGQVCTNGACVAGCASPNTTCGGDGGASYCADLRNDPNNCNACGNRCPAGQLCNSSVCAQFCGVGQLSCPGIGGGASYCANSASDFQNCGACAKVCGGGLACSNGACATPPPLAITADTNLSATNTNGRTCADGGDMVSYSVAGLTATTATLANAVSAGCLSVADEVILINLQGVASATTNVGNFERFRVLSVSGSTVTFSTAKTKFYGNGASDDTNLGVARGNQRVMLQRIPAYGNVGVATSTTLTGNGWNGVKGGIFTIRSFGTITVAGTISMKGAGYAGAPQQLAVNANGIQGESIGGLGGQAQTANFGGGGAGIGDGNGCDSFGVSGGGGGYGSRGFASSYPTCGGAGGNVVGAPALGQIFLGSGGASGGTDNVLSDNPPGGFGGNGGGAILLWGTSTGILNNGTLDVAGSNGEGDFTPCTAADTVCSWDYSGPGGGGSGGALRFFATTNVSGTGMLLSSGGLGGPASGPAGNGGNGGFGRILTPFASCAALKTAFPSTPSGLYTLTNGNATVDVYCDMTFDGGGWTLILDTANNQTPDTLATSTAVVPGSASRMPLAMMQSFANAASRVHMRTTDAATTRAFTTVANAQPIINLRAGHQLNFGTSNVTLADYTGPFATQAILGFLGPCPANDWPSVYHACGNAQGLHVSTDASRWVYDANGFANEPMQVYVK